MGRISACFVRCCSRTIQARVRRWGGPWHYLPATRLAQVPRQKHSPSSSSSTCNRHTESSRERPSKNSGCGSSTQFIRWKVKYITVLQWSVCSWAHYFPEHEVILAGFFLSSFRVAGPWFTSRSIDDLSRAIFAICMISMEGYEVLYRFSQQLIPCRSP